MMNSLPEQLLQDIAGVKKHSHNSGSCSTDRISPANTEPPVQRMSGPLKSRSVPENRPYRNRQYHYISHQYTVKIEEIADGVSAMIGEYTASPGMI